MRGKGESAPVHALSLGGARAPPRERARAHAPATERERERGEGNLRMQRGGFETIFHMGALIAVEHLFC